MYVNRVLQSRRSWKDRYQILLNPSMVVNGREQGSHCFSFGNSLVILLHCLRFMVTMPEADKTHAVTILKTLLQLYIPTSFKSTRSGFLQKHGFPEEYKSIHM
jgi:hypothetical protein